MRKRLWRAVGLWAVIVVLGTIMAELALRKFWGLGDMAIVFQKDSAFEYIPRPNQEKVRFGNRITYNEYSMRSEALAASDECVVLGFGDSVINGGTLTDHDSLATTIVENRFIEEFGTGFRFLNISAPSWGPDNCAAYLDRFGSFEAKMIVLFVSSHDAHDLMTFEDVVGVHPSYPDKVYPLALLELLGRYVAPIFFDAVNKDTTTVDPLLINEGGVDFSQGFDFFLKYSRKNNIPLVVCLHAEKSEIEMGDFNEMGKEILSYCDKNNIKVISGLEIGEQLSDFRDLIHINEMGQKRWARSLYKEIYQTINGCW